MQKRQWASIQNFMNKIYENFHRKVTDDSLRHEFLNWYEYIDAPLMEMQKGDEPVYRKQSIFSPLDMEDSSRIDSYIFLSVEDRDKIKDELAYRERERIVPELLDFLRKKGYETPESIETIDDFYNHLESFKSTMDEYAFEDLSSNCETVLWDAKAAASEYFHYQFDFDLKLDDDESQVFITFHDPSGVIPRQDVFISSEFNPYNQDDCEMILRNLDTWLDQKYEPMPWLKNEEVPAFAPQ